MSGWCRVLEPVSAVVPCGGEEHRVSWRRGKVVLEDHGLSAELAMLGLGGEVCACLRVLQAWRKLYSWAMSPEIYRQMRSRLGVESILAPGDLAAIQELTMVLSWQRAWTRTAFFGEHERVLQEQLQTRAIAPLREHVTIWMGRHGCRLLSSLELRIARPGQDPGLRGRMDGVGASATARLGVDWLLSVWARGLALVDGAFVLEVLDDPDVERGEGADSPGRDGRRESEEAEIVLAVRAVRWDLVEPAGHRVPVATPATVHRLPPGPWSLTWADEASRP